MVDFNKLFASNFFSRAQVDILRRLYDEARQRANHTGTQAATTISDFADAARAEVEAMLTPGTNITLNLSGSGATRQIEIVATGGGGLSLPVAMAVSSLRI